MERFGRRALLGLLIASAGQVASSDIGMATFTATGDMDMTTLQLEPETAYTASVPRKASAAVDHGRAMIDWIRANGGFVHASLQIAPIAGTHEQNPDHVFNNTPFALFTKEPLEAGETILIVPYNLTINSEGTYDQCDTGRNLHRELLLGKDSRYAPYILYLLDTQTKGQTPCLWSNEGRNLLKSMLRHTSGDGSGDEKYIPHMALPPYDVSSWEYLQRCNPSPEEEFAFELVRYRSWDDVMIPVYDMMSHSNHPDLFNTESTKIVNNTAETPIVVSTTRSVPAGGQIYCSYNVFTDSGNLYDLDGTPFLFADFGFVESYPQRWIFDEYEYHYNYYEGDEEFYPERTTKDVSIAFDVEQTADQGFDIVWLRGTMNEEAVKFVRDAVKHLKTFEANHLRLRPSNVAETEWNNINEYHRAMSVALEMALDKHSQGISGSG